MRPPAADAIIEKDGKIVLIKRGKEPFFGQWALPGGHLEEDEALEDTVVREAKEETGLDVEPVAIHGVYSDPKRDPRGIVGISFVCELKGGKLKGGDDASEAKWFPLEKLPKLAADHSKILKDYLKWKRDKKTRWSSTKG